MNFLLAQEPIDMPAPFGFDTWLTFWMCIAIATINAIAMCFAGYRFLQVLQLSGYKIKGYFAYIKDTKGKTWGGLIMLSVLSSAALLMTNVLLSDFFYFKIMTYLGLVFYLIFLIMYLVNMYALPAKIPLRYTRRMTRLMTVMAVLVFVITFIMTGFSEVNIPYFRYGSVALIPALLPLIIVLAHYITMPFEVLNNKRFVKNSTKKLNKKTNLIKIGITGSYGKTTVKNILGTILSEKYKVCTSPHSFNTPMGISKTVLNNLKDDHEVFIAEMGARHVGDIFELCDIVHPSIGILTGIGNQHLSTFGSQENLQKTKAELAVAVKDSGGKMYFSGDSKGSKEIYENFDGNKEIISVDSTEGKVFVSDISVDDKGSKFTLHIGEKSAKCNTTLLGKHNISNILLCCAVCADLGLSINEIKAGISKLVPTAHRLALIPSQNSLIVIDDAYNANVAGSKAALEVLKLFNGKKYVITPGLVELGSEAFNANFQFGIDMAKVCDKVIIDGALNFEALQAGLLFGGMAKENILRAATLRQATEVLQRFAVPGDVVLFENDLPDNYT